MSGQQLLRILNDPNFIMQASLGKIEGVSHINKFGMNPQITTASDPEDVWDFEGTYTFSSSANIDSLSSSDAGDSQDVEVTGTTGVSAGFAFLLFNNSVWGLS